eukprot:tig00000821_g4460.t1
MAGAPEPPPAPAPEQPLVVWTLNLFVHTSIQNVDEFGGDPKIPCSVMPFHGCLPDTMQPVLDELKDIKALAADVKDESGIRFYQALPPKHGQPPFHRLPFNRPRWLATGDPRLPEYYRLSVVCTPNGADAPSPDLDYFGLPKEAYRDSAPASSAGGTGGASCSVASRGVGGGGNWKAAQAG